MKAMNIKQRLIKVGLLIAGLITLSIGFSGCGRGPLVKPTPTCNYGWGPYLGKDVPGWTDAWNEAIREAGVEVKDARVQGIGETSFIFCGGEATESWEMAYQEIQATLLVEDVSDLDALGDSMVRVYRAVQILVSTEKDLAEANLSILFVSGKDQSDAMRWSCSHIQGIVMIEQGKNGRELFDATCSK